MNEFANLTTLADGRLFLHSVEHPDRGWIIDSEIETLADGHRFLRHVMPVVDSGYGFVVEQQTINGNRVLMPIEYLWRPK
jgi:hypothetical protein